MADVIEMGVCPGCSHHCSLKKPRCNMGRNIARNQAERASSRFEDDVDYSLQVEQPDYGQTDLGYDPEGLADPDAHNVKGPSWDIDWDL